MPYTLKNPPDWLKNLPKGVQKLGIEVFNETLAKTKDEDKARKAAWGAIKNVYKKNKKGKWVKKEEASMKLKQFLEQLMQEAKKVWKSSETESAKRDKINAALHKTSIVSKDSWVSSVFPDVVIVRDYEDSKWLAIEYTIKGDVVEFGESTEVEQAFIPKTVKEAAEKKHKEIQEKKKKKLPELKDVFYAPCITEEKEGALFLKGMFAEADVKNQNKRIYPKKVLENAVKSLQEKFKTGMDSHPPIGSSGSYRDVALKFTEAWMENNKAYCKAKVLDTAAGKDLKVIAEEDVDIGLSMRGYGEEKFDKKLDANVVQDNYSLAGIDAVLEPAFEQAKVIREQKEKELLEQEGGPDMDELKKQIAKILESLKGFTAEIKQLKEKGTSLSEEDKKLLTEMKAQVEKENAKLEAKKKVIEILESEELKDFGFKDVLQKHLENCETVEEVEKSYPRTLETLKALVGQTDKPEPQSVIIEEKGLFGEKKYPNTIREVYQWLLDPFKDTGFWEGREDYNFLDNPKRNAKVMLDNFLKYHMVGGSKRAFDLMSSVEDNEVLRESRRNPMYYLTKKGIKEALGDTEAYTSDVAATAAALLPLYWFVMQDVMNIVSQIVAIQALNVPTGKIFFGKEYYGDGAGTWTEIGANFDRTKGETAEGAAPQYLKIQIASNDISLETALKFIAPWTKELEQDLRAYHRIPIDSVNIQMARREVMRAISHKILYKILTATSYSNADNCVQATGSPLTYPLLAPAGYSQAEWERVGLTKTVNQSSALIRKSIWGVKGDNIIVDSDFEYCFQERHFSTDDVATTGWGFDKVGQWKKAYNVWTTNIAEYDTKGVVLHRGSAFFEAPYILMPYILFYIGDVIQTTTLKASRSFMSRFAMGKTIGKKIAVIDFAE